MWSLVRRWPFHVSQVHQELDVSLLTGDRRRLDAEPGQSYRSRRVCHLVEDPRVNGRVPNDSFSHLLTPCLELWLDERHHIAARPQQRWQHRQDLAERDEGHVDADEVY